MKRTVQITMLPHVLLGVLFLTMAAASQVFAQEPPSAPPAPKSIAVSSPSPIPQATATPAESDRPTVYGTQGVLIETLDGRIVASQAVDETFNPASSVKLATALVALRTFGPNHRFSTGFWTDGVLDQSTGQLNGNLYVTGRDPSFHHEHAIMVARQLNSLGIKSVTGNLVVAPGFTMNFSWSPRGSGESLINAMDSNLRSSEAMRAWTFERTALGDLPHCRVCRA